MVSRPPYWSADYEHCPARLALAVTPNDAEDLQEVAPYGAPRAIYVGGDGNIRMRFGDTTNVDFVAVKAGSVLPMRPTRIMATGTSASMNIVALY